MNLSLSVRLRALSRLLFPPVLLALFVLLLFQPAFSSEATLARLVFFARSVFPSLFAALCLSGLLVSSPPARALYRFPFGVELTALLLGVLCGFPVGARTAVQLYEEGRISKDRAEFLCGFSNLASLPFLVGVVGSALFGDVRFGVRLALLQAASALLTAGVLYALFRPSCHGIRAPAGQPAGMGISAVARAVAGSAHTMLELGGMLIFFGVAADLLLHVSGIDPAGVRAAVLQSALEFSSGVARASALGGEGGKLLAAAAVGFSGLCVWAQIAAVTRGKLSLRPYLLGKSFQCALLPLLVKLFA
ncbi:MAG: hypothetical protein J1E00_00015 [Oscillospiraceae bacterium]|nr:hypothetical protein [Oscillospiraceae bacterium]